MSGLEVAIMGAVASQVSKTALEWLQSQGSEISEEEWKQVGYQIGIEIQSIDRQSQRNPEELKTLERELTNAAKVYQKLEIFGEDFDFDSDVVSLYSNLADICGEWAVDMKFNTSMEEHRSNFEELHKEYKETVM
ncbi:hypothetical protein [Halopelagius longus]|uniref:Uncharacterized protein n=1 Tax=Halopelagius longus TaxID=1236180 RepID=A0A1H1AW48_9EURY|nr:hypothetical protein [Halopelagius longus]RDI70539.1 hypothetical protein DWB78_01705 [Halopelagius longus]SDQ43925.1 hypothetical protein SAMN05216278_1518 [Halopelagius longus]